MTFNAILIAAAVVLAPAGAAVADAPAKMSLKPQAKLAYSGYPTRTTCWRRAYKRCLHDTRDPWRIRVVKCRRQALKQCGGLAQPS